MQGEAPPMANTPDIDLEKRRRDLYAISLGLLIFNLAGGSLKNDASVFFGAISITRPRLLLFGAWIAWAYFLWQFWLVAKPFLEKMLADIDAEIHATARYRNYCKAHFELILEELDASSNAGDNRFGFGGGNREALRVMSENTQSRINKNQVFRLRPHGLARDLFRAQCVADNGEISAKAYPELPASLWDKLSARHPWQGYERIRTLMAAIPSACLQRNEFSNRILPLCVAFAAPIVQIARAAWQFAH